MREPNYLLYALTNIINAADEENSNTIIAKAFLELRNEINDWTLDRLAAEYYVSQAGISRFIKSLGYKNYNDFRSSLQESQYVVERINYADPQPFDAASAKIYEDLHKVTEDFRDLDRRSIDNAVQQLRNHDTIWFIGSELSMGIIRLLQMKLIAMGKTAYTLYSIHYQKEILRKAGKDDLVVTVSLGQRWFSIFEKDFIESKHAGKRMLWTVVENHSCTDRFDSIVMMGKTDDANLGYHYLMQFILLMYTIL